MDLPTSLEPTKEEERGGMDGKWTGMVKELDK